MTPGFSSLSSLFSSGLRPGRFDFLFSAVVTVVSRRYTIVFFAVVVVVVVVIVVCFPLVLPPPLLPSPHRIMALVCMLSSLSLSLSLYFSFPPLKQLVHGLSARRWGPMLSFNFPIEFEANTNFWGRSAEKGLLHPSGEHVASACQM